MTPIQDVMQQQHSRGICAGVESQPAAAKELVHRIQMETWTCHNRVDKAVWDDSILKMIEMDTYNEY